MRSKVEGAVLHNTAGLHRCLVRYHHTNTTKRRTSGEGRKTTSLDANQTNPQERAACRSITTNQPNGNQTLHPDLTAVVPMYLCAYNLKYPPPSCLALVRQRLHLHFTTSSISSYLCIPISHHFPGPSTEAPSTCPT